MDDFYSDNYDINGKDFGLSNLAATFANLLGYDAPDFWDESMIKFK